MIRMHNDSKRYFFGLDQHEYGPIHIKGHNLDFIISRCDDKLIEEECVIDALISDHKSVKCDMSLQRPERVTMEIRS